MPVKAITAQGPGETAKPYLIGVFGIMDVTFSVIAAFSQVCAFAPNRREANGMKKDGEKSCHGRRESHASTVR